MESKTTTKSCNMKKVWWKTLGLAGIALGLHCSPPEVVSGDAAPTKVQICHRGQTLMVSSAAVQAHLNHGDTAGPCVITPSQNP
jgi:hypothetical protein